MTPHRRPFKGELSVTLAWPVDPGDAARMALLEELEADPSLYADEMDRVRHRGRINGREVQVAVAPDGRTRLRLMAHGDSILRFGTRAQLPHTTLATGDPIFDDAVGVLGKPVGLIRLGAIARARIAAWLGQPKRWVTDTEVGGDDIPIADLDAVVAEGAALLESLAPPKVAEMLEMRLTAPDWLRTLITQRLLVRLGDASDVLPVFRALSQYEPPDRLRWLAALGEQIAEHPTEVLALLPRPLPADYDRHCVRWAATYPVAAAHLAQVALDATRRRPLIDALAADVDGLREVFARMPHDRGAVADIEALTPLTAEARLARIEALANRPAGDPRAWRADVRVKDGRIRRVVSAAIQGLLPAWLEDPQTAALALGELGLAESNSALLIDMVERDDEPALVALLARTPLTRVKVEQRRLEVLSRAANVPPFDLSESRAALEPGLRAAAEGVLVKHLPRWLADPTVADALRNIGPLDETLTEEVLAVCRARPCPGAVRLLASLEFRAEKDRVGLVQALALTGVPAAEAPLLKMIGSGYAVRLACIEGLAGVGGKASLKALQGIAGGFFVEKSLKQTALRSIAAIETRLGGGAGALSMATADGRLSMPDD